MENGAICIPFSKKVGENQENIVRVWGRLFAASFFVIKPFLFAGNVLAQETLRGGISGSGDEKEKQQKD